MRVKGNSLFGKLVIGVAGIFLLFVIGGCEKEKSVTGPTAFNASETSINNAAVANKCDTVPINQQCVAYVKEQKPEYNFYWGGSAYLIWYHQKVAEKGGIPKVSSVMVLNSWAGNNYGHVGIVRSVGPIRGSGSYYYADILIDHRNWNCDGKVLINDSFRAYFNTYGYGNTVKRNSTGKSYPLLGFIYKVK
jgi:hypothetical protein